MLFSVTVILVIVPDNPATLIGDGNGVAVVPLAGKLMLVGLEKTAASMLSLAAAQMSNVVMHEIHFIGMGNSLRPARSHSFLQLFGAKWAPH